MVVKRTLILVFIGIYLTGCTLNSSISSLTGISNSDSTIENNFYIESKNDGSGMRLDTVILELNQHLDLFAISRDKTDKYLMNSAVNWSLEGAVGTLVINSGGQSATYNAGAIVGSSTVTIIQKDKPIRSVKISVVAPTLIATKLQFVQQPAQTGVNLNLSSISVEIQDQNGNRITSSNALVTLAFDTDPSSGSAVISGSLTSNAINGLATFSNLSINFVATGYKFSATADNLAAGISTSFNITAGSNVIVDGITGGTDSVANNLLSNGTQANVSWQAYAGVSFYKVAVLENDGTTIKCAEQTVSASTLSYNFSSCTLTDLTFYRARVIATNALTAPISSTTFFQFYVDGSGIPYLAVQKVYPNYSKWNDYVKRSSSGADRFHQTETACVGSEKGSRDLCFHSGVIRKVVVTGQSSCNNLSLSDSFGVFVWYCTVEGGVATFYSYGLKNGKGLRDLIDTTGWKDLYVTVLNVATPIFKSLPEKWWDNTILSLPDNNGTGVVTLSAESTIYTYSGNKTTSGYNINANGIGIVGLSSQFTLTYVDTSGANCSFLTGETATPDNHCLIAAGGNQFLWIEVKLIGDSLVTPGVMNNILLYDTRFSNIVNTQVEVSEGVGIHLKASQYNKLFNIKQASASTQGVHLNSSSFNTLSYVSTTNNTSSGILIGGVSGSSILEQVSVSNIFTNIVVANNGGKGLTHGCANSSGSFSNILLASNSNDGFEAICGGGHTLNHVTAINNSGSGMSFDDYAYTNYLNSALLVGNSVGLDSWYSTALHARNIAATNNSTYGYRVVTANNSRLLETFIVGNNGTSNCLTPSGVTTGGVVDGSCSDTGADQSNSYTGTSSTATLLTGRNLASSLNAKVTTNDVANTDDTNGFAASVTKWFSFDSFFRMWGKDGNAFADVTNLGRCTSNCRIWDLSLSTGDTFIKNTIANGISQNPAFVNGAACPALLSGNNSMTDGLRTEDFYATGGDKDGMCDGGETCTPYNTFLKYAFEITDDYIGDDDGFCETNEACIYAPNYGAYQGTGDYTTQSCTFSNGTVSGVTMYAYPTN